MPASPESATLAKAVAARVGITLRVVRNRLKMTQLQLAAPNFTISYISAIEHGRIRPSLKALSLLAERLDVPLTFLLEGSPTEAEEARAIGFSRAGTAPDPKVELELLQGSVLVQQGAFRQAEQLLAPLQAERLSTDQVYRLYLLRGELHFAANEFQEAVVAGRAAVIQAERLNDADAMERAHNFLGTAYFELANYTLAREHHTHCAAAIDSGEISDPVFALSVFSHLANDLMRLGDMKAAVTSYRRALEAADALGGDSRSYASTYLQMSLNSKGAGKLSLAQDYALRSLALYNMRDTQRLVGLTHQRLGKIREKQGQPDEAEREYRRAIAIELELNDAIATATCHTALAELLLKRGKHAEAEEVAQAAFTFAQMSEDAQAQQGQALLTLAQLRHAMGDYATADDLFERALALLDASHAHDETAEAYFRFAQLLEERGEVQRSVHAVKQAYGQQRKGLKGDYA